MDNNQINSIRLIHPLLFFLRISLLIVFLHSLFAWFLWDYGPYVVGILCTLAFILYFIYKPKIFKFKRGLILSTFLLLVIELYTVRGINVSGYLGTLLITFPILFVLLVDDEIKIDILRLITKSIALILLVSSIAWVLFLAGLELPYRIVDFNNGQYWYRNYYFFLYNIGLQEVFPRFSSVFLEPGQLGMITVFLLYANRFDFKRKEIVVLLIATILTFSLAAYILLFVSFSFYLIMGSKRPVLYLVFWLALLALGVVFSTKINDGNNLVNQLIIERLQIYDGELTGNNRFSTTMDSYFKDFIRSNEIIMGIGTTEYNSLDLGANAGYKVFLVRNGLVGTALLFLFYLSLVIQYRAAYSFVFLLIYALSFLQASYALWGCVLLIFITAMPFSDQLKQ